MTLLLPPGRYRFKINVLALFFYNIFLILFKVGVRIAALFNTKARKWVYGRKGIWQKLESEVGSRKSETRNQGQEDEYPKIIWVHCASLGEFEQGRPLIEKLRAQSTGYKILLTFFSPSGYEIRKDYKGVDWVFYLPMDGPQNARRFLAIVNPSLVVFVKYEFWYYYLKEIKQHPIHLLLISALFRENSAFFKWYGALQRKMLSFFDHLFVQDERSKELLASIGLPHKTSIAGDTRFDRVIETAEQFTPIPAIEQFIQNSKTIVAGSTWPGDEQVLQKTMAAINDRSLKLIIAPHEINKEHIAAIQHLFPHSILFSDLTNENSRPLNVLIIDNIGMLSRLYNYASIAYIGGGFGKGIHNTLEAAVYGKPVLFGPAYYKFREAIGLINAGGARSINNAEECITAINRLIKDDDVYSNTCKKARDYVYANRGATQEIMNYIQEKRLLTS